MSNQIYKFNSFQTYDTVLHGVSTKKFGSMKNTNGSIDFNNIEIFKKSLGLTDKVVFMDQIHSGNVSIITDLQNEIISNVDGMVTNKKHIALAVLTADCLPLLFLDPEKQIIGVAHAGNKGLLNHVIENIISIFVSKFTSDPKDILVGIGPGIEKMCYEVGEDMIRNFELNYPTYKSMYIEKDGKFYLDLKYIAFQNLIKAGIPKNHVEIMDICTKCDQNFYSYRKGDINKRFASIISIH